MLEQPVPQRVDLPHQNQSQGRGMERKELIEPPLTPEELVALPMARIVAQGILGGCFVNQQMPSSMVARYRELSAASVTDETEAEKAYLMEVLSAERDRLGMAWMLDGSKQRFSKILGDLTDVASGRAAHASTPEETSEAIRFTRDLLELGKAPNPRETVYGYDVELTSQQAALAERLQRELNRREMQRKANP